MLGSKKFKFLHVVRLSLLICLIIYQQIGCLNVFSTHLKKTKTNKLELNDFPKLVRIACSSSRVYIASHQV